LGRDKVEKLISELIVAFQQEDYEKVCELLSTLSRLIPSFTPSQAKRVDQLLIHLQDELKLKEISILKSLSNRGKVKESYLKCSS